MDAVSEVIAGRLQQRDAMQSTLSASLVAHLVLVAVAFLAPAAAGAGKQFPGHGSASYS